MAQKDALVVDARPTKEFFIYMLTKDIKLVRSIIDLIDNSWDGAIRSKDEVDLKSLWIRIDINADEFRVSDNCGGIPYDIAKNYAFRFGRPKNMPRTDHSVGQFGVGMKRSLFKLGTYFKVDSKSPQSKFTVEQDVNAWVDDPEWEFRFSDVEHYERKRPLSSCGTTISVTGLHDSVKVDFASDIFLATLKSAIQEAHQKSLDQGLSITLNKVPLKAPIAKLMQSAELKPASETLAFDEDSSAPVTVKLLAGIAESDPDSAGWNVFCNGRLILGSDDTNVTGWGEGHGRTIPKFHNQFARFRGYAFFDCDDASKLPWNTTKTGVDSDSRSYQSVRQRMITLMRPVIDFLNRLDAEKDAEPKDRHLTTAVESAKQYRLETVNTAPSFVAPTPSAKPKYTGPVTRRIQYDKTVQEIEAVKAALGVTTLKEVGEGTFDYFYELECD